MKNIQAANYLNATPSSKERLHLCIEYLCMEYETTCYC